MFELYWQRDQLASHYKLNIDETEEVENEKKKQRLHSRWIEEGRPKIQKKLAGHLGPLVMNLVAKGPHPHPLTIDTRPEFLGIRLGFTRDGGKEEQKPGDKICRPPGQTIPKG